MRPNAGRGMRRPNNPNRGNANRGRGSSGSRGMDTSRLPSLVDMERPTPLLRDPPAPLVTNHLQNLDMELALLKLKREIIEQQHQMLSGERSDRYGSSSRQSQFSFDQPQQSYSQQQRYNESSTSSFAQFYDDPPSSGGRAGAKRSAWDPPAAPAPKRHHSDAPRASSRAAQRSKPLVDSKWSSKPRDRKDFQPNKVTKPVRSKPTVTDERKRPPTSNTGSRQDLVLREGIIPSRQMTGRLELGLGSILKEMRESRPQEMGKLSGPGLRAVKQVIRERVHAAMVGKEVGPGPDIVRAYRARHPPHSDLDLIKIGLQAEGATPVYKLAMSILEADNAETFFKTNVNKLLNIKLDELLDKMKDIYERDNYRYTKDHKTVKELIHIFINEEGLQLESIAESELAMIEASKKDEAEAKPEAEADQATAIKTEDKPDADKNANENTETTENDERVSKDEFIVIDTVGDVSDGNETKTDQKETKDDEKVEAKNDEKVEAKNDEKVEAKNNEKAETKNDDKADTKNDEIAEANVTQDESKNDSNTEEKMETDADESVAENDKTEASDGNQFATVDDESKGQEKGNDSQERDNDGQEKGNSNESIKKNFKASFYTRLIDALIKRRLPYLLPKFKDQIIRILNIDQEFKNTMACVMVKTKKKALDALESGKDVTKTGKGKGPLYFVKILGRPSLPKRNKMQAFLDQFHPASIKKHRGVHNLLFVGFANKEDFDGIIAASRTVIDNCTLDIKESKSKKDNAQQPNNDSGAETRSESEVKIDKDLDNQINDLLNSIREDEENKLKETEERLSESLKEDEVEILPEKDVTIIDVDADQSGEEKSGEKQAEVKETEKDAEKETAEEGVSENLDDTIILDDKEEDAEENDAVIIEDDTPNGEKNAEENRDEDSAKVKTAEDNGEKDKDSEEVLLTKDDNVEVVKNDSKEAGKSTPARSSARIATSTPSTIRTRRASKMAQNQNN